METTNGCYVASSWSTNTRFEFLIWPTLGVEAVLIIFNTDNASKILMTETIKKFKNTHIVIYNIYHSAQNLCRDFFVKKKLLSFTYSEFYIPAAAVLNLFEFATPYNVTKMSNDPSVFCNVSIKKY